MNVSSSVSVSTKRTVRWGTEHGVPRLAMAKAGAQGDLLSQLMLLDAPEGPGGLLLCDRIREAGQLCRGRHVYSTANLATTRDVLSSNDFGSSSDNVGVPGAYARLARWASSTGILHPRQPPSLFVSEPPDHTRYRRLLTKVFTVRAVEEMRPNLEMIAGQLLDDVELAVRGGRPVELVSMYCAALPLTVISEILGVPRAEWGRVHELGTGAAAGLDVALGWRRFRTTERFLAEFDDWLGMHVQRIRDRPGDDLFSQLVHATEDGGLTDLELKSTAGMLLAAGFETTVNLLGSGIALLATHSAELERLRADPSLWGNATEEVLRYSPPVLLTGRIAHRTTIVAGEEVPQGSHITTLLVGANRDPAVFAEPNRFDVGRANARDHVSFSAGRHHCLGAALARMEGEIGLRSFFRRFDEVELIEAVRRKHTRIVNGYERVIVRMRE
jgi:cytochrome P450